jgi:hypothetical protein
LIQLYGGPSLAFDHLPLDQPLKREDRRLAQEALVYLPISLGSVVVIVLVPWLIGVV